MEQSPSWEPNSFSASQDVPRIIIKPECSLPHSKVPATCPYPEPGLSSPYPHISLPEGPLSSHLRRGLQSGLLPLGFPTKIVYNPLPSLINATFSAHLIFLDFISRKLLGEQYEWLSYSLDSFLQTSVSISRLWPHIILNTSFSNTPILRFFLNVSYQVSHPYKTMG
jgi:hypothetical protein